MTKVEPLTENQKLFKAGWEHLSIYGCLEQVKHSVLLQAVWLVKETPVYDNVHCQSLVATEMVLWWSKINHLFTRFYKNMVCILRWKWQWVWDGECQPKVKKLSSSGPLHSFVVWHWTTQSSLSMRCRTWTSTNWTHHRTYWWELSSSSVEMPKTDLQE